MAPSLAENSFVPPSTQTAAKVNFNPFYSNIPTASADSNYEFEHYKPSWPKVDWEPLPSNVQPNWLDAGLRADKEKKALFGAASKVDTLSPAIGTKIEGVDLRNLSDTQKDEL